MNTLLSIAYLAILLVLLASEDVYAKKKKSTGNCRADFFTQYHASSDINNFIDSCVEKYKAKSTSIGKSAEGRPLKVVTVGSGSKEIFLMAGLHGREWITPAATLYTMYELMRRADEGDSVMLDLLSKNTVHMLLLVNPDGYDFTRTKSETQDRRQWRKNRRLLPCKGDRCAHGVDLNRNWGIEGRTFGFGATRPTSDVYQGKRPFSEPEIRAIRDWLLQNDQGKNIEFVLDIHCCAQTILPPSYYNGESAALKREHLEVARRVANAMTSINQEQYGFREREQEFSATNSGISVDWIYGESGVGLALIVETRGNEKSRKLENIFDVDTRLIPKIGEEVLAAVFAVSKETLPNRPKKIEPETTIKIEEKTIETSPRYQLVYTPPPTDPLVYTQREIVDSIVIDGDEEEEPPAPLVLAPQDSEQMDGPPPPPVMIDRLPPQHHPDDTYLLPPGPHDEEQFPMPDDETKSYRRPSTDDDDEPPPGPDGDNEDEPPPGPANDEFPGPPIEELQGDNWVTSSELRQSLEDSGATDITMESFTLHEEDEEPNEKFADEQSRDRNDITDVSEDNEVLTPVEAEASNDFSSDDMFLNYKDDSETPVEHSLRQPRDQDNYLDNDQRLLSYAKESNIVHHDSSLIIIEDIDDADEEALSRELRSRINSLRALRKVPPQSKWMVLKSRIRKGRWKAPVAFALAAFVLWHFATRKTRRRRID